MENIKEKTADEKIIEIQKALSRVLKEEKNCKEGVYYNPHEHLGDVYCTFVSEVENILLGDDK